jgi:hypothetical protein
MSDKKGRNDLCSCGSGKKYKKCCGFKAQTERQTRKSLLGPLNFAQAAAQTAKSLQDRHFKIMPKSDKVPGVGMIAKSENRSQDCVEKVLP